MVPDDLAAADGTGFKWSLYYEEQGYSDPSVAQIQSDLSYIKANYATNPNFLTIDGKPVIFVYAGSDDGCAMAQRWNEANATEGFYTVLKVFSGYAACASDASAWHQYAPAEAEDDQAGLFVHHLARLLSRADPSARPVPQPVRPGARTSRTWWPRTNRCNW